MNKNEISDELRDEVKSIVCTHSYEVKVSGMYKIHCNRVFGDLDNLDKPCLNCPFFEINKVMLETRK